MPSKEFEEMTKKIRAGLALAERKMLEEKALRGQDIIVCDKDNKIQRIPARSLL